MLPRPRPAEAAAFRGLGAGEGFRTAHLEAHAPRCEDLAMARLVGHAGTGRIARAVASSLYDYGRMRGARSCRRSPSRCAGPAPRAGGHLYFGGDRTLLLGAELPSPLKLLFRSCPGRLAGRCGALAPVGRPAEEFAGYAPGAVCRRRPD